MESALKELIKSGELKFIALLNASGDVVASAGAMGDFEPGGMIQTGEHWEKKRVTLVNLIDLGMSVTREGETNTRTIVLPPRPPGAPRDGSPRDRPPPRPSDWTNSSLGGSNIFGASNAISGTAVSPAIEETSAPPVLDALNIASTNAAANDPSLLSTNRPERRPRWRRPFNMSEAEYQSLLETRGLHGLAIAMSTENFRMACAQDLWMRVIIGCFAGMSVFGLGLAWQSLAKSSELQLRLLRASELNTHLKEMNLAAAGLAHETRNPLNIIRGLAQMISRQQEAAPEVRVKSREIVDETDRVTAQLNEFINYSRPREVRRSAVVLSAVIAEVVRALNYDIEEKRIRLQVSRDQLTIEADEQLLRQALFNLLLNAIQAADMNGEIQMVAARQGGSKALLDIIDNGPGVPESQRLEIFKPYFTTHEKGTGLGLAVVQQIVLAHGWEIQCLANQPRGAIFRITHLKLAAKG